MKKSKVKAVPARALIKLDLGCGINKRQGFIGVDSRQFDGVDQVVNLAHHLSPPKLDLQGNVIAPGTFHPWPWENASVEEAHCSHFVEHLTGPERIHFVNELYRVLIPGGKCQIVVPNWASARAYGDLTHQWPPVCEFWFYYLSRKWREGNAPHNDGYRCNFSVTWGYTLHTAIAARNQEYQSHAIGFWKEAAQDIVATLVKTPMETDV